MKKTLALILAIVMALGCMSITAFAAEPTPLQNGGTVCNGGNYSAVLVKGAPFTIKVDDFSQGFTINYLDAETYPGATMNDLTGELTIIASEAFFDKIGETGEVSFYWGLESQMWSLGEATVTFTADADSLGAQITAEITAADFAYEMVIPSGTTLTEAKHENVLLGTTAAADGNGIVTVNPTAHNGTKGFDIVYTVDLTSGTLTDGTNTIATTYGVSDAAAGTYSTIGSDTKVTVYNGAPVNSYVKVTADDTEWKAAPTGTYNATLTFNFAKVDWPTVTFSYDQDTGSGGVVIFTDNNSGQKITTAKVPVGTTWTFDKANKKISFSNGLNLTVSSIDEWFIYDEENPDGDECPTTGKINGDTTFFVWGNG